MARDFGNITHTKMDIYIHTMANRLGIISYVNREDLLSKLEERKRFQAESFRFYLGAIIVFFTTVLITDRKAVVDTAIQLYHWIIRILAS
jgi:hypothetical protein